MMLAIRVTTVSAVFPLCTALMTPKRIPKGMLITKALKEKNRVIGTRSISTSSVGI